MGAGARRAQMPDRRRAGCEASDVDTKQGDGPRKNELSRIGGAPPDVVSTPPWLGIGAPHHGARFMVPSPGEAPGKGPAIPPPVHKT
jgi:hypothetical protein